MDYKNAGVDIEAGYESVELMKKFVKGTMRPEVLGGLGGFSGAFWLDAIKNMEVTVAEKEVIQIGLEAYVENNLDFVDCILYAYSCVKKYDIKTFDKKLNKLLSR